MGLVAMVTSHLALTLTAIKYVIGKSKDKKEALGLFFQYSNCD